MAPRPRAKARKSGGKSGAFAPGDDARRGKGPAKGAQNAGRPPSAIREAYRLAAADRLSFLCDVIDGKVVQRIKIEGVETEAEQSADVSDRLRAWDMLNKYGIGTTTTATDRDGNDPPPPVAPATPNELRELVEILAGRA